MLQLNYNSIRKHLMLAALFTVALFSEPVKATSYVWNGSVSTEWGNAANWTPAGIPDLGDDVTISNQTNNPVYEEISGLNNFTMTSGSLDLDAFTLVVYGSASLNGGTISNGGLHFLGSVVFAGTTISAGVTGTTSSAQFNGSTFNNSVNITFNGSSEAVSSGGNTFNEPFTLTNSGSANIILCNSSADTYKKSVTFTNSGSALIHASYTASGSNFEGNINFVSTGTSQGVRLGQNGGTSTLFTGSTLNIGVSGFSTGDLRIRNLTQSGSTAQSLTLTGNAALYVESGCTFNGNVTFSAPQVFLNGATYAGTATISKTSSTSNTSLGGNTFTGAASLSNSGSGDFILGVSNPDVFSSTAQFSNTGSGTIFVAHVAAGTTFAQNITVNSTGSSKGVRFGQSGGTCTLASGRTINIGGSGFTAGSLRLRGFTQSGTTAQTLNVTSGSAQLYLESNTTFNGNITFAFPQVFLNGFTAAGTATITKNGSTDNSGSGGNTFNGVTTLVNSGSGRLRSGNSSPDTFGDQLTLTNSGGSSIQLAHAASGTTFAGNLIVNSTGSSSGIYFGENSGTSTLAASRTITIGSEFSSGYLSLKGFTQTGATDQTLTDFSGSAIAVLGSGTTFNGNLTLAAPGLQLNGASFNGICSLTKNGTGGDISNGGNTFNQDLTLINSGDGELLLSNSSPDIFNGDLFIENSSSDLISVAFAGSGNEFNGNVELSCTGSASGIRFGQNGGTSSLASGRTITIGSGGFDSGDLRIANFTQTGSTAQSLTGFSGLVEVYLEENTTFNGNLTVTAPGMYLNGTTFNGTAAITKTGTGFNLSNGGNVFNNTATISNTGSGTFILAGSSADDFNEDVTFLQTTAFTLYPAYNVNSTFAGDISTSGSTTAVVFAANGGRVTMNGTSAQSINGSSAQRPDFFNITLNNSAADITLNVPAVVSNNITFSNGKLITTSTNLLTIADNATVSSVSNSSHVQGPCRKEGNEAFTFPIGKTGVYRPVSISAPSATTDHFTAEFYMASSDGTYSHASKDVTLDHLSQCEYWILDRTAGSSSVQVTLSWNTTSCGVTNLGDLRVARWNGSTWKDHGNGGTTGSTTSGTVASSGVISSFSPFTLASRTSENPLPVNLISFSAQEQNRKVLLEWSTASETNNEYFSVEASADAVNFTEVGRVAGAGNSNVVLNYKFVHESPQSGVSYYRLRQVDFDGEFMHSAIEAVNLPEVTVNEIVICPNPVVNVMDVRLDPFLFHTPQIEIRDLSGKLVKTYEPVEVNVQQPCRIDLNELPQGIYFLHVSEGAYSVSKRIVKQ
jgi:hypothetical protein